MTQVITPAPSFVVERLALAIKAMTDLVNSGQQLSELQQASLFAFKSFLSDYELSIRLGVNMIRVAKPNSTRTVQFDGKAGFMLGECNSVELYLGDDCAVYEHRRNDASGRFEQINVNRKPDWWRNHIFKTLRCMRHLDDPKLNTFGF